MAGFRGLIGYRSSPSTVGERGGKKERLGGERGEGWRERENKEGGKEREEKRGRQKRKRRRRVTKFDNTV